MSQKFRIRSVESSGSLIELLAEAGLMLLFTLLLGSPILCLFYILRYVVIPRPFGLPDVLSIITTIIIMYIMCLFAIDEDRIVCLVRGHRLSPTLSLSSINGFEGDEVIFRESCARCGDTINLSARYDAVKLSIDMALLQLDTVQIPDEAEREARIAIADSIRGGVDPPEAALRIYALYHVINQVRRLQRLELPEYESLPLGGSLSLDEVLREIGVKLDFKVSERGIFQLLLRGDRLYVEAPHLLAFTWKERGVGLDIVELRVVEVARNRHANRVIALIQLVGRPFPKSRPLLLDTVMVGRDASGPWLLRAPPRYWNMPLERQLSWTTGLGSRRRVREA